MALSAGSRLGPYEIVAPLGVGGMGEVFRARDTRLDRAVAIKVLGASLASDPALRERFDREARAISSLNHPHICTLFDVGHQDGVDFLVLEYLEGETVAERLAGGRLDPGAALRIAIDICDALDKAHRSGIVHRDLKPANVFLVWTGASAPPIAKLLDFGLAKSAAPVVATSGLSMLPTTPPNLTAQGTILGTFQYMAPEQIEGLEADARTDIFAFGALLFEMITGRPAFEGKTRASLLGAILKDETPPVSRLQPVAPPALDRIIGTCLAKDPDDRYQTARDLLRDLKWVASGSTDAVVARPVTVPARSSRVAWLVAALATIALIAASFVALRRGAAVAPAAGSVQFTVDPPENRPFGGPQGGGTGMVAQLAVSPDGRNIVFVAGAKSAYQIWQRPVDTSTATPIPGTEDGAFPFWSPDSRSIGFFAGGKLKSVQLAGGPPRVLADAPFGRGGTWSRDNVILFSPGGPSPLVATGIVRMSSAGGVTTAVTTVDPAVRETFHRWPYLLPDGRHFLYSEMTGTCCPSSKPGTIKLGSLDPNEAASTLLVADSSAVYASGHVLFVRDETLMALPFDPVARQARGDPFPLAEHVSRESSRYASVSVSENGTLVYAHDVSHAASQLTWVDRAGRALATLGEPASYINVTLSPDERRIAVAMETGSPANRDIWIFDNAGGRRSRVTSDPGTDSGPVWSPDGLHIAFSSQRSGKISLRQTVVNGTDESLLEGDNRPSSWSMDGRFIAYTRTGAFPQRSNVWILPLFGERKPFSLVQTEFIETSGMFSPDGRWMAYTSDEAGQPNVYVRGFPASGQKYPISKDGGSDPVWRSDGKELFFLGADGTLMAAPINATGPFDAGAPQVLFATSAQRSDSRFPQAYTVTKDGQRFLVIARSRQSSVAPISVLVNWPASIRR